VYSLAIDLGSHASAEVCVGSAPERCSVSAAEAATSCGG